MTRQEIIQALKNKMWGKVLAFGIFTFLFQTSNSLLELSSFLGFVTVFVLIFGSELIYGLISAEIESSKKDKD